MGLEFWRREKSFVPAGNLTPVQPALSLVATPTTVIAGKQLGLFKTLPELNMMFSSRMWLSRPQISRIHGITSQITSLTVSRKYASSSRRQMLQLTNIQKWCEIWVSSKDVDEDSGLEGCHAVLADKYRSFEAEYYLPLPGLRKSCDNRGELCRNSYLFLKLTFQCSVLILNVFVSSLQVGNTFQFW